MPILWLVVGAIIGAALTLIVTASGIRKIAPQVISTAEVSPDIETLQARAARLQQALDALPVGVVVANNAGEVVVRNSSSESIGIEAHSHVLVHAAMQQHLRAALRGGAREQTIELYGPPRRVVIVSARPLADSGAVATVEDVTERSRVDSVRTDFVANISHELKTPIGALAVLAETLIDETDPAVIKRLAGKTVNEAHRVARTIDDLLELSRIELSGRISISSIEAGSLIGMAIARSRYLAEQSRVIVEVGDVPARCRLHGDQTQLESALGNLIDNAVKYSEPGDHVVVSAELDPKGVVLEVSDNGIGIPNHDLDRVFERFYRVDRARSRATGGTGLGLSIVRHVAQNHGGNVTVTSHEGEGSVFRLFIPNNGQLVDKEPSA